MCPFHYICVMLFTLRRSTLSLIPLLPTIKLTLKDKGMATNNVMFLVKTILDKQPNKSNWTTMCEFVNENGMQIVYDAFFWDVFRF